MYTPVNDVVRVVLARITLDDKLPRSLRHKDANAVGCAAGHCGCGVLFAQGGAA